MKPGSIQRLKIALGLLLGMGIGAACRILGVPCPAPSVMTGALLVVAMTVGYIAMDGWMGRGKAQQAVHCGGPDGSTRAGR